MDDFKRKALKVVSRVGCPCCDNYRGKDRPKMRRQARQLLKQQDQNLFKEATDD